MNIWGGFRGDMDNMIEQKVEFLQNSAFWPLYDSVVLLLIINYAVEQIT